MSSCVVIQCFCKKDETIATVTSLEGCVGVSEFNLLLYVDKAKMGDQRESSNIELIGLLSEYKRRSEHLYKSVRIIVSETNLGPYIACFRAIEYAFTYNEFVVFSEDDITFCKDSLTFYKSYRDRSIDYDDDCIGVTANSLRFYPGHNIYTEKSGTIIVSPEYQDKVNDMRSMAINNNLSSVIEKVKWAPNKQMGLFAVGWDRIKKFRRDGIQGSNGEVPDVATGKYVKESPYYFIYSFIPRSNDIGLFHKFGCSTMYYDGDPGYSTIKYLTSDDLECHDNSYRYISNPDEFDTVIGHSSEWIGGISR